MKARFTYVLVVWAAVVVLPASGWAQQDKDEDRDGHRHGPPAATDAAVDFGVLRDGRRWARRRASKPLASAVPTIRVPTCCIT